MSIVDQLLNKYLTTSGERFNLTMTMLLDNFLRIDNLLIPQ